MAARHHKPCIQLHVYILYSLEEVRGEFDDFQESSRELEAELEAQLEQAESTNKDLLSRIQRLEEENESIKVSNCKVYTRLCDVVCLYMCG